MAQNEHRMVALASRADIFEVDRDRRVMYLLILSAILALLIGFLMMTMEKVEVPPEYYENLNPQIAVTLSNVALPEKEEPKEEKKPKEVKEDLKQKVLKMGKSIGSGGTGGTGTGNNDGFGSGDIKARVSQKGLLAIISGKNNSGRVVGGGSFMSNSSAIGDLDKLLDNMSGLKTSGKGGVGRMGLSGSKFNQGYGGTGGLGSGGAGGIDGLLGALAGGSAASVGGLTKRADVKLPDSKEIFSDVGGYGGRSPQEIMAVVMNHLNGLRAEYNKRLRDKPMLKGTITLRFTVEPSGHVTNCTVVKSTMNDKMLELSIVSRVRTWLFEACGKCGMATVTYPFTFSQ